MAFSLNRTQSLGTTVTRQHLYDLINTCTLSGSANGGGGTAGANVVTMTATSGPIAVPADDLTWWWDKKQQLLKVPVHSVAGSPCSLWLSVGPDSWEVPVYNSESYALWTGCMVSFKEGAGAGHHDVGPTVPFLQADVSGFDVKECIDYIRYTKGIRGMIGFCSATIPPGEFGTAVYRGFGYMAVDYTDFGLYSVGRRAKLSTGYSGFVGVDWGAGAADAYSPIIVGAVLAQVTEMAGSNTTLVLPAWIDLPVPKSSENKGVMANTGQY